MKDILENKSEDTGFQLQVKSNDTQYCYLRFLNATLFIIFASFFYTYAKWHKYLQYIHKILHNKVISFFFKEICIIVHDIFHDIVLHMFDYIILKQYRWPVYSVILLHANVSYRIDKFPSRRWFRNKVFAKFGKYWLYIV